MDQLSLLDQKLLLNDLPGMAYLCHNDSAWTMLFVSAGGKALTGWPASAFINNRRLSFQSLIHPQDRESVEQHIRDAVRMRRSFHVTYRLIARNGEIKWVSEIGSAVRNQHGGAWLLQGYITDITAERSKEQALTESLDNFRELTRAMPYIVWSADANGVVDYISPTPDVYCGDVPAEGSIPYERWEQAVHPADIGRVQAAWRVAHQTGSEYSQEMRLRTGDDLYRWHLSSARPVYDHHGNIRKWYGAIIDIHERRLLLQDARRLASRLVNTLESITDAFITLDQHWRISYINAPAEEVLQVHREEVLGNEMWAVLPDIDIFEQQCRNAMEQQLAREFMFEYTPLNKSFNVRIYPSGEGVAVYFREAGEKRSQPSDALSYPHQLGSVAQDVNNLLGIIQSSVVLLENETDEGRRRELLMAIRDTLEKGMELSQHLTGFLPAEAAGSKEGESRYPGH